jgi:ureidoglycolate amidohydrolase
MSTAAGLNSNKFGMKGVTSRSKSNPRSMVRVDWDLKNLAKFSDTDLPAVTRVLFTEKDLQARDFISDLFEKAGLEIRTDAIGNLFARWNGSEPHLPAVATGSHTDAIPQSGKYDGTVGVIGAIEAIRLLKESGFKPKRSIEIIMFTSEEPTRFGVGCIGSRMLSGSMKPSELQALKDESGTDFDTVRKKAGFSGDLESVVMNENQYSYFIELHIEQGPLLEQEDVEVGIVSKIAAPARLDITLEGEGGHAGAVLMHERNDTACAAAEITLMIERLTYEMGGLDTVATTGIFTNGPGAVNSIPRHSYLGVDVRDIDLQRRDAILDAIQLQSAEICKRRGVRIDTKIVNKDNPVECSTDVVDVLKNNASNLGITSMEMISRAYHDCLFMAHVVPSSMIFVPCLKGYSHRPEEYSSPEQIDKGVRVLAESLKELSML